MDVYKLEHAPGRLSYSLAPYSRQKVVKSLRSSLRRSPSLHVTTLKSNRGSTQLTQRPPEYTVTQGPLNRAGAQELSSSITKHIHLATGLQIAQAGKDVHSQLMRRPSRTSTDRVQQRMLMLGLHRQADILMAWLIYMILHEHLDQCDLMITSFESSA